MVTTNSMALGNIAAWEVSRQQLRDGRLAWAAQVGAMLCEDAPQELRSRMWMALLADPTLCGNLMDEKVGWVLQSLPESNHHSISWNFLPMPAFPVPSNALPGDQHRSKLAGQQQHPPSRWPQASCDG